MLFYYYYPFIIYLSVFQNYGTWCIFKCKDMKKKLNREDYFSTFFQNKDNQRLRLAEGLPKGISMNRGYLKYDLGMT